MNLARNDAHWDPSDVPSLTVHVALVTGASRGVGKVRTHLGGVVAPMRAVGVRQYGPFRSSDSSFARRSEYGARFRNTLEGSRTSKTTT
jgi:hypothetical protein